MSFTFLTHAMFSDDQESQESSPQIPPNQGNVAASCPRGRGEASTRDENQATAAPPRHPSAAAAWSFMRCSHSLTAGTRHLTLPSYFSQDILFCEHLADGTSSRIDGEPEKPHLII